MTMAAIARCPACRAVVNAHWVACLACRASLEVEPTERGTASAPTSNWLGQWQRLAQVSGMISGEDPRYAPVLAALAACQTAYKAGDREQFAQAAQHVMRIAAFVPGAVIQWRGHDKKLHGPATVTEVIYEDGRLWACGKWAGRLYWVSELIIESISVDGTANPSPALRTF